MVQLRVPAILALTMVIATACRHPVLVADSGPKPPTPAGTISGQLQTPGNGAPVVGRLVAAINNGDSQRFETRTNNTGGFTIRVPPGHYRIEVEQRAGEAIAGAPTDQQVGPSDIDAKIVITVGPS